MNGVYRPANECHTDNVVTWPSSTADSDACLPQTDHAIIYASCDIADASYSGDLVAQQYGEAITHHLPAITLEIPTCFPTTSTTSAVDGSPASSEHTPPMSRSVSFSHLSEADTRQPVGQPSKPIDIRHVCRMLLGWRFKLALCITAVTYLVLGIAAFLAVGVFVNRWNILIIFAIFSPGCLLTNGCILLIAIVVTVHRFLRARAESRRPEPEESPALSIVVLDEAFELDDSD